MLIDFSAQQNITDARYWNEDVNQLYHPLADFGPDSFEYVYSKDMVTVSKFTPILLKEWFAIVRPGGCLIVDYIPNEILDFQKIEEFMWWLWKKEYEIVFHDRISTSQVSKVSTQDVVDFLFRQEGILGTKRDTLDKNENSTIEKDGTDGEYFRFICRKTKSSSTADDSMNSWSFGIITNGTRIDFVKELITSIRKQKIPNYEIIICGTCTDEIITGGDVRYLPFDLRDLKGWITRKKNLIVEAACYENLMILHDRIILDDHWYSGMKIWGNCFEVLALPQYLRGSKKRLACWQHAFFSMEIIHNWSLPFGFLEYQDWGKFILDCGPVTIAKKRILRQIPYNEVLYWGEFEDCILSNDLVDNGYIFRLNPNAVTYSQTNSLVSVVTRRHKYDTLKLGRLQTKPLYMYVVYRLLDAIGLKRNHPAIKQVFPYFFKMMKKRQKIKTHEDLN